MYASILRGILVKGKEVFNALDTSIILHILLYGIPGRKRYQPLTAKHSTTATYP